MRGLSMRGLKSALLIAAHRVNTCVPSMPRLTGLGGKAMSQAVRGLFDGGYRHLS